MSKYTRTPPEHRRRPGDKTLGPDQRYFLDVLHLTVPQRVDHDRGAERRAREDAGPLHYISYELLYLFSLRFDVHALLRRRQAPADQVEGVRLDALGLELREQSTVLKQ